MNGFMFLQIKLSNSLVRETFVLVVVIDNKYMLIVSIEEDDLRVTNEDEVYDACLRWLDHAPGQRKTDFHKVRKC